MTDLFHEIPGNPTPENAAGGFFTTRDGKKIRYGLFPAIARPMKGTVVLLTGRNECIEKYFGPSQPGRPGSRRRPWTARPGWFRPAIRDLNGYVKSFFDYTIGTVIQRSCCPTARAIYILAIRRGRWLPLASSMVNRVRRMVPCAVQLFDLPVSITTVRRVCSLLWLSGLGGSMPHGVAAKQTAPSPQQGDGDGAVSAQHADHETYPQLALGGPTIRWLRAAAVASETVSDPHFMARIQVPLLIIAPGTDQVVSTKAVEAYARHLRLGSLLMIHGARHEILQEADIYREQFLAAFDAFIPGTDETA